MSISDKINQYKENVELSLYPSFKGKSLNIEIASGCNERCIYCTYYARGTHKMAKMIDEKLFYRVTKEAYELGITDVGLYMTGEPLTNPNVYKYVDYLKNQIGFQYVYISTNGILLNPSNLEKLVNAGIDSIKFSVSGYDKKSFMQHHGVDAFEKVYQNIKYAFEYRKKNNLDYKLYMFSVITKYNETYKKKIEELYTPFIDEIVMSNVLSNNSVKGVKELLSVTGNNKSITSGVTATVPCNMLFNRISISENGYLLACCYDSSTKSCIVADLHTCSLKDGVYGEAMVDLRKRHLENRLENTICNYCVRGIEEKVYPLTKEIDMEDCQMKNIDMTKEIKERFEIE